MAKKKPEIIVPKKDDSKAKKEPDPSAEDRSKGDNEGEEPFELVP